jgi:4'-phosphopantetheinyl transferase
VSEVGWLTVAADEVPRQDHWLHATERPSLARYSMPRRRADWRLGRFAAKRVLSAWLDVDPDRLAVLAAADGAPEAFLDEAPAPVSLSISHREGRAVVAVVDRPAAVGCDLELIETRSDAFVLTWLAVEERAGVEGLAGPQRALAVNACWTAKEAALKVVREGLRVDARDVVVTPVDARHGSSWRPVHVELRSIDTTVHGASRVMFGYVVTVATEQPVVALRLVGPGAP